MIWFILTIIICVIYNIYQEPWDKTCAVMLGIFIGLIPALLVTALMSCILEDKFPSEDYISETIEIYSLEDNFKTEGSAFILGCSMSENLSYYYIKNTDKGYLVDNTDSNNCYLHVIKDNSKPRIENHSFKFSNKWWYIISFPIKNDYQVLYIPKNTIKTSYNVDLQ